MPKHSSEECSNCRYWLLNPQDADGAGSCRVCHPVILARENGTQTIFPQTRPGNWCGEYAALQAVHLPESYKEPTGPEAQEEPIPPMPEVDVEKKVVAKSKG